MTHCNEQVLHASQWCALLPADDTTSSTVALAAVPLQDIEEGEGDDGDGGVATAMEGVQLSDGGRGGAGGSLPGPSGEGELGGGEAQYKRHGHGLELWLQGDELAAAPLLLPN